MSLPNHTMSHFVAILYGYSIFIILILFLSCKEGYYLLLLYSELYRSIISANIGVVFKNQKAIVNQDENFGSQEFFMLSCRCIVINGRKPLTIITKHSILNVAAALDPPLRLIDDLIYGTFWFDLCVSYSALQEI